LQPAINSNVFLDPTPAVMTFFAECSSIRVMPYANLALIGIPYSSLHVPIDLLSIPHEIGHYVYWHSRSTNPTIPLHESLEKRLSAVSIPPYVRRWIEEIFADTYACRVAGSLYIWTGQRLKRQFTLDGFFEDDDEHPAPVLRPYIYQKALFGVPDPGGVIAALKSEWDNYWDQQINNPSAGPEMKQKQYKIHNWQWIDVVQVIDYTTTALMPTPPIDRVVTEIFAQWPAQLPSDPTSWLSLWKFIATGQPDDLDPTIHKTLDPLTASNTANNCQNAITTDVEMMWQQHLANLQNADVSKRHLAAPGDPIPVSVWREMLYFEGWATKITGDPRRG
jgi:hypothetical protein